MQFELAFEAERDTGQIVAEPMRRRARKGAAFYRRAVGPSLLALASAIGPACKGLNVFTPEDDRKLGAEAYAKVLKESKPITSGPSAKQVQRVTERIVRAAEQRDPALVQKFDWRATLLDEPQTVNAFCLPGGYMAVYSGILPVTESETGLAVVLGHEVAHATRRHGTQRLSQALAQQYGVELATQILGGKADPKLMQAAAGVALDVFVNLKYSREHELEADRVGLEFMARAGYDPREALQFWQRMASQSKGAPPEWLSTHPAEERRIAEIQERLPAMLELWRASGGGP